LNEARVSVLVLLSDGNVLVSGNEIDSASSSCEIYDINTNKWRYTAPMNILRYSHRMILLNSGKVLAIGGGERSCEIFNPVTEEWRMTDSINATRDGSYTVTKLKDGRIMVIGGFKFQFNGDPTQIYSECDIYDPIMRNGQKQLQCLKNRYGHASKLIKDSDILVTGGFNHIDKELKECEIYSPDSNTWTETDSLVQARLGHSQILLDNGNVLLVAGTSFDDSTGSASPENHCLLYNVQTVIWLSVGLLAAYRNSQAVFRISSNNIIVVGGDNDDSWDIYDIEKFKSVYIEKFQISLLLNSGNTVQIMNNNLLFVGGMEYTSTGFPVLWPTKKCFEFNIITGIKEINTDLLNNYRLYQNYPNPFNPTTEIKFQIPKASKTKPVVYGVLGNKIKTFVDNDLAGGNNKETWNGTGDSEIKQPSGIYFIKLISGNYSLTIKTMLLN